MEATSSDLFIAKQTIIFTQVHSDSIVPQTIHHLQPPINHQLPSSSSIPRIYLQYHDNDKNLSRCIVILILAKWLWILLKAGEWSKLKLLYMQIPVNILQMFWFYRLFNKCSLSSLNVVDWCRLYVMIHGHSQYLTHESLVVFLYSLGNFCWFQSKTIFSPTCYPTGRSWKMGY